MVYLSESSEPFQVWQDPLELNSGHPRKKGSSLGKIILVSVSVNIIAIYVLFSLATSSVITSISTRFSPHYEAERVPYVNLTSGNFQDVLSPIDIFNASAIFNTVQGALKEKNSNLNPVGVSYVPVYIPEGTLLYHSNRDGEIPESLEWVAMDAEFSYSFAHFNRPASRSRQRGPPPGEGDRFPGTLSSLDKESPYSPSKGRDDGKHGPSKWGASPALMTFKVTKPLNKLIYLDGASAAKTGTGEMDTQMLLSRSVGDRVNEREAAKKICEWGKDLGLDGIVRLEIGFEIIICDFFSKLELISNVSLSNVTDLIGFPGESELDTGISNDPLDSKRSDLISIFDSMSGFDQFKAGEQVNDGDYRLQIDFTKMVTVLNRTYLNPDPYLRRINNLSISLREDIIHDVAESLINDNNPNLGTNWQSVTTNIMNKFGPIFAIMNNTFSTYNDTFDPKTAEPAINLARNISVVTYNYVRRYTNTALPKQEQRQNAVTFSIYDYAHNTHPVYTPADFLIASSVFKVQSAISHAFFDLFDLSQKILVETYVHNTTEILIGYHDEILEKGNNLRLLIEQLRWSIYYRCGSGCAWDEFCYIPTWGPSPFGWGSDLGTYPDEQGKKRISKECLCVNYQTIMSYTG